GLGRRAVLARGARLGELDHDAERLLGVQERLRPLRIRVVVTDDPIAGGLRAAARLVEARNREGHVMDAGTPLGQEPVEEAIGAPRPAPPGPGAPRRTATGGSDRAPPPRRTRGCRRAPW